MFRHVIPDLETLNHLGYRSYPRWFREAPRAWQEANALEFDAIGLSEKANRPWLMGNMPSAEGSGNPSLLRRVMANSAIQAPAVANGRANGSRPPAQQQRSPNPRKQTSRRSNQDPSPMRQDRNSWNGGSESFLEVSLLDSRVLASRVTQQMVQQVVHHMDISSQTTRTALPCLQVDLRLLLH